MKTRILDISGRLPSLIMVRVIFTPQVKLEPTNAGVNTSIHAKYYNPNQLKLHCIWVAIILSFSDSKIQEF